MANVAKHGIFLHYIAMPKSLWGPQFEDESKSKLAWLIQLRALAWLGLCVGAFAGPRYGFLPATYLPLYLFAVALLGFWNVYTSRWILRGRLPVRPMDLFVQLVADLAIMTFLLSLTGGIYNPLCTLLLVHVVIAALVLSFRLLWIFVALILTSLAYLQWNPDVAHLSLRGEVTRTMVFLSLSLIGIFLAFSTRSFRDRLEGVQGHLRALREKQDRMDRLKLAGAMAAGFSHEFSSPLFSLRLNLQRIHRNAGNEESESALASLEDCERILRDLTENGLKSRQLDLEILGIKEIVAEWVREYRSRWPEREVQFESQGVSDETIEIPRQPLQRSFFDLLDNAYEAMAAAKIPSRHVSVVLDRRELGDRPELAIRVFNRGEPVPPVVLEKWGEPFVTTKEEGTGLGVFNAITLLRAMGGDVRIGYPEPGLTEFAMVLPLEHLASEEKL